MLCVLGALAGCPDDGLDDLHITPVAGTEGRQRFVVTFEGPAPDLTEYRRLLREDPSSVPAFIEKRRAEMGHPEIEGALSTFNGRIVERWWMSGQVTVEMQKEGLATLRAIPGVKSVDPDLPLQ